MSISRVITVEGVRDTNRFIVIKLLEVIKIMACARSVRRLIGDVHKFNTDNLSHSSACYIRNHRELIIDRCPSEKRAF